MIPICLFIFPLMVYLYKQERIISDICKDGEGLNFFASLIVLI